MSLRTRAFLALVVLLAAGAGVGAQLAVGDTSLPVIYVNYRPTCGFGVTVSGLTVDTTTAPGVTIPPGPYQVQITSQLPDALFDPLPDGCNFPQFTLSGPGVSWSSTLKGAQIPSDQATVTLLPSSTYSAVDANHPGQSLRIFSTSATGSSSSLLVPGQSTSAGKSTAETQGSLIGSAVVPFRGDLQASVSSAGKATLRSGGKGVARLRAGQYDVVTSDESTKGGFFVQKASRKPVTITSVGFVGPKKVRVYLSAGVWTFYSTTGRPTQFVVD